MSREGSMLFAFSRLMISRLTARSNYSKMSGMTIPFQHIIVSPSLVRISALYRCESTFASVSSREHVQSFALDRRPRTWIQRAPTRFIRLRQGKPNELSVRSPSLFFQDEQTGRTRRALNHRDRIFKTLLDVHPSLPKSTKNLLSVFLQNTP